jgi:hypothetical protein
LGSHPSADTNDAESPWGGNAEYMAATRMKERGRDAYEHLWKRIEPELGHLYLEEVDTIRRGGTPS